MNETNSYFKFMTNILVHPREREIYVAFLKKYTKDAMVPTMRLVIAGLIMLGILIFSAWLLLTDLDRFKYFVIPVFILDIASIQLAYYYIISSRRKSMLASIITMLTLKLSEKVRLKSSKFGELNTLGIKSFKRGYLLFEDGDYGVCYATVGQLDKTTLPQVAEQVHGVRSQYLISRNDTSHEMTITSIKRLNVDRQIDYYKSVYQANNTDPSSLTQAWSKYMSQMIKEEMENKVAKNEVSIYQYLILRDVDPQSLAKSQQMFELACADGMYASVRLIVNAEEFLSSVGTLTMISKKGENLYVEKEEQERSAKKFERQ